MPRLELSKWRAPVHPWSPFLISSLADAALGSLSAELIGRHLARALVLNHLVRDLLTFAEIAHSGALDSADVDENVLTAIIRLDEAKTLGRIKPLNCAGRHDEPFLSIC